MSLNVRVELLKDARYKNIDYSVGSTPEIPSDLAATWIRKGVAKVYDATQPYNNALKVTLLQSAKFSGVAYQAGDTIDVPLKIAGEWIANKIAKLADNSDPIDEVKSNVSQLQADTANQVKKTSIKRKAYVTIIDDDGRSEFITNGHSAVVANHPNAKITLAINPNSIGNSSYLTLQELETFKANAQYEIINHGWSHTEPLTLTLEELKSNYELEKAKFIELGLNNYDYYAYSGYTPPPASPNQVQNAELKNKLRQVYKCCLMNTDANNTYIPFDAYEVRRVSAYNTTPAQEYIDYCIEHNGWCVLFGHAWMEGQNDSTKLDAILTYIDGKVGEGLIEYVSVKEMIDNYSNIFEMGNGVSGADYFLLDINGNIGFTIDNIPLSEIAKNGTKIQVPTPLFTDKDADQYQSNAITIEAIDYNTALSVGLPNAGMLITIRRSTSDYYSAQIFTKNSGNGDIWKRVWVPEASRWSLFSPITSVSVATAARPRQAPKGLMVWDSTLAKPVWQRYGGEYTANKTIARSTAYQKWDVINPTGSYMYVCIVGGTTGASEPTWDTAATYNNTVDGTVTWQYLGTTKASWVDATGTAV